MVAATLEAAAHPLVEEIVGLRCETTREQFQGEVAAKYPPVVSDGSTSAMMKSTGDDRLFESHSACVGKQLHWVAALLEHSSCSDKIGKAAYSEFGEGAKSFVDKHIRLLGDHRCAMSSVVAPELISGVIVHGGRGCD